MRNVVGSTPTRDTNIEDTLDYKIHFEYCGKPKSHQEWADGFNVRGKIRRLIENYQILK